MDLVRAKIRYQINIECRARDTISRARDGASDLISNAKVFKGLDYSIQRLKILPALISTSGPDLCKSPLQFLIRFVGIGKPK